MSKKPGPEKLIQNAILDWLRLQPEAFAWRNNNGAVFNPRTKGFQTPSSKYAIKGVADIIGLWDGRFLAIEVKAGKNTTTMDQRLFLLEVEKRGGIAFVAKSLDEVIRRLKCAQAPNQS